MNAPAADFVTLLNDASALDLTTDENLYDGDLPPLGIKTASGADMPERCVACFDTGGFPSEDLINYQRPTVQVRVRGPQRNKPAAYALAESIKGVLDKRAGAVIGSTTYIGIWLQGDILWIGWDDQSCPIYSLNFVAHRTE